MSVQSASAVAGIADCESGAAGLAFSGSGGFCSPDPVSVFPGEVTVAS
ncbi:hypothetical protein JR753_002556 [Escherichia coli]|nr:hypothetical protein [Escherichia coli]